MKALYNSEGEVVLTDRGFFNPPADRDDFVPAWATDESVESVRLRWELHKRLPAPPSARLTWAPPSEEFRCEALTRKGQRCKSRKAMGNHAECWLHLPLNYHPGSYTYVNDPMKAQTP